MQLLEFTESGIYCREGDFYIDPWKAVKCAIITHAHSDHARWGSSHYISHNYTVPIIKFRLGNDISATGYGYNETFILNGVKVSLHPAGHIVGSAQVRIEHKGEVWVVSGDYKTTDDGISTAFEPIKCHTFISESTFGLPIFNWKPQNDIFAELNRWWANNAKTGTTSIVLGYSLGKAQRILQNINPSIGQVYTHGAVENVNELIRNTGIVLHATKQVNISLPKDVYKNALVIAPPSVLGSPWLKKFEPYSIGIASGWMALRGARRRRNADMGFVISDHADWGQLNEAIAATGAEKVFITHGYQASYVRFLREQGLDAYEVKTQFTGEMAEDEAIIPDDNTGTLE